MIERPFILLIDFYRFCLSPLLPRSCRFYPTCSTYAREAILSHGLSRGILLTAFRVAKCHPFHPGGFDPVPATPGQDNFYGK